MYALTTGAFPPARHVESVNVRLRTLGPESDVERSGVVEHVPFSLLKRLAVHQLAAREALGTKPGE